MLKRIIKSQSPARIIATGFALAILLGSFLLMLPCSVKDGVTLKYIDALYTSTSAVCVTGLLAVDTADTFTVFGQVVIGVLIQIGGLGVALIGAGVMLAMGAKVDLKSRTVLREALNLGTGKGLMPLVKSIFIITIFFELAGAVLSFTVFVKDYPPLKAAGISLFHSVASFNNAGFDILGGFKSLTDYKHNVMLNIVTSILIVFGGLGFLVIKEVWAKRFKWKKFSMHTKVVLATTAVLLIGGTLLIKATEKISWMCAFFSSVTARTAGFSTYSMGNFSDAGLLVMVILMVIGASPGSTGGGIKTTTFFALIQGIKTAATNKSEKAFHYSLPKNAYKKASVITIMAIGIILFSTYLLKILEPQLGFMDALFEMTSAFGTVGLSTGITPTLGLGAKLLSIVIMYIGRLGPLTIATLWYFSRGERTRFPVGEIAIG